MSGIPIVAPAFNSARYINAMLRNVLAQRTNRESECIVVDDDPPTMRWNGCVRLDLQVTLMQQVNTGPSAARFRADTEQCGR